VAETATLIVKLTLEDRRTNDWEWTAMVTAQRPGAANPFPVRSWASRSVRPGDTITVKLQLEPGSWELTAHVGAFKPGSRGGPGVFTHLGGSYALDPVTMVAQGPQQITSVMDVTGVPLGVPKAEPEDTSPAPLARPEDAGALRDLTQLLDRLYLGPFVGYPEADLLEAESRIGRPIPRLWRSILARAGRHPWLDARHHGGCHHVEPTQMIIENGFMRFYADQQDCWFYGMDVGEPGDDPMVSRGDTDPDPMRLSVLLTREALGHRVLLSPALCGRWQLDGPSLARLDRWTRAEVHGWPETGGVNPATGKSLDPDVPGSLSTFRAARVEPWPALGQWQTYHLHGGSVARVSVGLRGELWVQIGARTRADLNASVEDLGLDPPHDGEVW
jgi:hypothetical protein